MTTEKEFTPTKFVVTGRTFTTIPAKGRIKEKRAVGTIIQRVNEDGTLDGERQVYASKELRHKKPGNVYLIDAAPGSIMPSTVRYVERWLDGAAVLAWEIQVNTFELALTATKRERDDGKLPAALEHLRPLLIIYNRTNYQGRMALELLVLNWLRTSGGKFDADE